MSKNKYYPYQTEWDPSQWTKYCPPMGYAKKECREFPPWFPKSLTDKWNSAIVIHSGDANYQTFVVQGYRVDAKDEAIDEHQYIVAFNTGEKKSFGGFIEHPDYVGRTTPMSEPMKLVIQNSGINADIGFSRIPAAPSGSLQELIDQGLIAGFGKSVQIQDKKDTEKIADASGRADSTS